VPFWVAGFEGKSTGRSAGIFEIGSELWVEKKKGGGENRHNGIARSIGGERQKKTWDFNTTPPRQKIGNF